MNIIQQEAKVNQQAILLREVNIYRWENWGTEVLRDLPEMEKRSHSSLLASCSGGTQGSSGGHTKFRCPEWESVMYKPNIGKLNCLPRKHTVLIPKGIRRHGSCLEGQRPSCWAFTVNPVGTFSKDQPRKLKKKCLQKLHLGKSQQQFGTHP